MNKNTLVIENRKFLILDKDINTEDINTEDTVVDTIRYSVESTNSELYYITVKPDFQFLGYALEIL